MSGYSEGPDWLGLLKWSLQYSDGTTDPSHVTPMSEEDKAFLEQVMKECVKDEPTRMQEIIKRFTEILDAKEEEIADEELGFLLDELRDMIEQIDMSKVFTKFGGLTSVLMLLASNRCGHENREMAASVIGAIAQNNIEVQDDIYKMKSMHKLIEIFTDLTTDNYPMSIRAQCIYALSCVIRGHASAEATFSNEFAQVVCHACLASKHATLIRRIVFLCNALISSDSSDDIRVQQLSGYLLPHVLSCITCDDVDLREATLLLL